MNEYFADAKVGDEVWDYIYGKGEIVKIYPDQIYKLEVRFEIARIIFCLSGKFVLAENQSLFYYDNRPIVIKQEDLKLDKIKLEGNPESYIIQGAVAIIFNKSLGNNCVVSLDDSEYTRKVRIPKPEQSKDDNIEFITRSEFTRRVSKELGQELDGRFFEPFDPKNDNDLMPVLKGTTIVIEKDKIRKPGKTKILKTLNYHNTEQQKLYSALNSKNSRLNGIACPKCGFELMDSNPMQILMSNPPQKQIHCTKCKYSGFRLA